MGAHRYWGPWLVKGVTKIRREGGERVGLRIKVVEETGTSWGSLLTRPDLSGCMFPSPSPDNISILILDISF